MSNFYFISSPFLSLSLSLHPQLPGLASHGTFVSSAGTSQRGCTAPPSPALALNHEAARKAVALARALALDHEATVLASTVVREALARSPSRSPAGARPADAQPPWLSIGHRSSSARSRSDLRELARPLLRSPPSVSSAPPLSFLARARPTWADPVPSISWDGGRPESGGIFAEGTDLPPAAPHPNSADPKIIPPS